MSHAVVLRHAATVRRLHGPPACALSLSSSTRLPGLVRVRQVFGRCIAGSGACRGNMRYYSGVWICLVLGILASVIAAGAGV
jgi:hypothetical protein